jgi:hypothetical protein
LAAGLFAAGDAFFAGAFRAAGFLEADLALPAAGGFRAGFACFLTIIILVRYGAAGQGLEGAYAVPYAKAAPSIENGGDAKNLKL